MTSIFDLKTSVEELSSANQGTSRMEYDQHAPSRDVTTNNFPNGAIHFRFQTSGQKWWIPSRSYLRLRCKLSKADGTILTKADNVAPTMGLCSSLFQSAEFRINDKTVARVSDFMPQIDALETRLSKSRAHMKGIGSATNFWDEDFKVRQADVVADGLHIRDVTEIEPPSEPYSRLDLGLDESGGTGADRNGASYVGATGVVTFVQNGGAALPADMRTLFPVGSYFQYTTIQGASGTDVRLKKPARVVEGISATSIRLETGVIAGDVALDGRTDFVRVDILPDSSVDISRKVAEFELTWKPPLSIFKIGHALPSMKAELVLNPQTSSVYQKYAIQSLLADKTPETDYIFNVQNMYFYCNTVEGPRADNLTYLLDLEQVQVSSEQFSAGQQGLQQKNFDVSPSTYALTVAYQDARSGSDTRNSASLFKVSNDSHSTDSEELKLNRFFINYAGQNLPAPRQNWVCCY